MLPFNMERTDNGTVKRGDAKPRSCCGARVKWKIKVVMLCQSFLNFLFL